MGDIVDSERHPNASTLHRHFNAAIGRQNRELAPDVRSPLTITLGDEFQGLFSSLLAATRAAREIRFDLIRNDIDCRFVVGIVDLRTPINADQAWNMMGPGFADARERVGEKRAYSRYRFSLIEEPLLETMLDANGASVTAIERAWSTVQRNDILALLGGASVEQIANARNVSAHNIYKVRSAGDFELYAIQWHAIQQALASLDTRYHLPGAAKWHTHSFIPA